MKRTSSHWVHNNQALWEIWNMTLTSHSCPANSGGHWHTNPSNTAWHWPPFWHGLLSHLFLWISQRAPTKPGGHRQWWPPGTSYRKHEKGKWWERAKPFFFFGQSMRSNVKCKTAGGSPYLACCSVLALTVAAAVAWRGRRVDYQEERSIVST